MKSYSIGNIQTFEDRETDGWTADRQTDANSMDQSVGTKSMSPC